MFIKLSKAIYQFPRSDKYCEIIEIVSELQIQLSLLEITLLDKGITDFAIMTTAIQSISLIMNLRSPTLYDYFMDNSIMIWIINAILGIYLVTPLFIVFDLTKTKYTILVNCGYSWISWFGYIHLYILSYIIQGWLIYQIQEGLFYDVKNIVLFLFSLILIIINTLIAIFICKVCISRIYLPGFISHKSTYNRWMNLIFKLIFPIIQVCDSSSIKSIIFLILLIIWGILRQFSLVFKNPFYNYKTIKIMSCMQGITYGIIISNFLAIIIIKTNFENPSNIYGLLVFFIASLSSKCFMEISNKMVNRLLYTMKKLNDIDYASQYFLIEQFTENCHKNGCNKQNIYQDELISNGLIIKHQITCLECQSLECLQTIRNHLLETKIFKGLKNYKQSFVLNCLAINAYLNQKNNSYRSCFLIEKLKHTTIDVQDKLILKAYESKLEEVLYIASNDCNIDYGRYIACDNFYEEFLCVIKNETDTYLKFWGEINSPIPDIMNLIKFMVQIHEDHKKFKQKLAIYKKYFINDFPKPLLLSGLYYDILKNNNDESYYMLQKYTKFVFHDPNPNIADQINKDVFFTKNAVNIRISGSDDTLGNIISCSGNISEITNLTAKQLIGQNIAHILPNCFGAYHNDFIRYYKETGLSNIINRSNLQFCKHEHGHLVPVKTNILIYPILDYGLMFLGIIRIIKASYEYILISQDGEIEGMTLGISKDLNFKPDHDKINFYSILQTGRHYTYKEINPNLNSFQHSGIGSLTISQAEPSYSSINYSLEKRSNNFVNSRIGSQFFARMPQPYNLHLFQDFVDNYLQEYGQNGKKIIFKKISHHHHKHNKKDNIIPYENLEYLASLEKNCYKFGLQLYKLKLTKCNISQNKQNLKYSHPKIQLRTVNLEDNSSFQRNIREPNKLPNNQPFMHKPDFVRESFYDTSPRKPNFSSKKKVSYSINIQSGDKASIVSLNTIVPKIELNSNLERENIIRNETISLQSNLQRDSTFRRDSNSSHNGLYIDDNNGDDSYSIKSIYFIKRAKIKSQLHKKKPNISSHFFKFRSIFLEMNTLIMIILFILSILGIFIMHAISNAAISKIDRDLKISYHCNQRLSNIIEIDRRLRIVWFVKSNLMSDKRHEANGILSYSTYAVGKAYEASIFLIGNNSLIAKEIQYIDIISQNDFYSKLVNLYSVDEHGNKLSNYTGTDSFISGYQIYQVTNKIRKLPMQYITLNLTDLLFILRNNLNDIYIEYERSSHILINEIDSSILNIDRCNIIALLIILILSMISMLLLIPGLSALFYKKRSLLIQIVNINLQYCQSYVHRINQFYKGLQENYSDAEFINIYEENQIYHSESQSRKDYDKPTKRSNTNIYKRMIKTSGIKLDLAKSFFILLVISAIYIGIFYSKRAIATIYIESVHTAIQRLLFSSRMLAQQNFAMTLVYEYIGENGTTFVENNPIELVINQAMPNIANLEGFLTNFRDQKGDLDPNLQFIMIGNVCSIVPKDYKPDCVNLGGGPGQNGISSLNSFIYNALNTALKVFRSSNRTLQDANNTLLLWYLRDLEGTFYRAAMPAYNYLYNQLLNELNDEINGYKTFDLAWTLTTFFCFLIIEVIIWLPINRKLINEIMSMRQIMKILPKTIIERSRFHRKR